MYPDEEGCLTILIRWLLLAFLGFAVGLLFSVYFADRITLPKLTREQIIRRIPPQTKQLLRAINTGRKRFFLLPIEIKTLQRTLEDSKQQLFTERAFKEQLIEQTHDDKPYLVISLTDNLLYLKQRDKILRTCSVATGRQRAEMIQGHVYNFFTPRTIFTIVQKIKEPLWTPPSWAFHEHGVEPPPVEERKAIPGVLGNYALQLQGSYLIHGTINSASLGKYITHGCIRVGENDLKAIYDFVPVGTRVFIY
jgi:L,D-transpeptidase ErfK/SrfK